MNFEELRARLDLAAKSPVSYRYELTGDGLAAAVLVVFALDLAGEPHLLLTQRSEALQHHKGQIAFPGGICEPEDGGDPRITATREAHEEVGVDPSALELISVFPVLSTLTGFTIQPVIAVHRHPLNQIELNLLQSEIARVFWVPWREALAAGAFVEEPVERGGVKFFTDVFYTNDARVWGATGMIVKNLVDRWQVVGT
jgi:8-oxo-dGTP pyrophosphatase MutT (NUDIX family)